jgi:hypothetical protein
MKSATFLLPLLLVFVPSPSSDEVFTSLFNGKDSAGWKIGNPDSFKIEDGAIAASGRAGHAYYDGPFLNRTFKNFELKVDVMTRPNSNGGYVHTDFQEKGFPRKGFEIQVNNTYKDPVKSGSLYHVADIFEAPAKDNEAPAQAPAPQGQGGQPKQPMSFFITSVGLGKGANLGGLEGADKHCQALAAAVGAGDRAWRAYLSTQGPNAVNARDRIGKGPWFNVKGQSVARDLEHLHGDTLDQARMGNTLTRVTALTEKGDRVLGAGDQGNAHDILTGSQLDGRAYTDSADHTCNNWTSESAGSAQVGHHDRAGGPGTSWNSVHATKGCSQENLVSTGGAGLFYCFSPGSGK